ncbi:hypothetical protein RRG08_044135 [Elysia crispata]|uniref:Secreted protein n=1 Tax=Elysia crispata TaxID=231223 RepID=A0AAE0Z7B8_9GAST|nr:hypothetical protein RRG08_044135 [Elysia crispata]
MVVVVLLSLHGGDRCCCCVAEASVKANGSHPSCHQGHSFLPALTRLRRTWSEHCMQTSSDTEGPNRRREVSTIYTKTRQGFVLNFPRLGVFSF